MRKKAIPDLVEKVGAIFPSRFIPYDFQREIILAAGMLRSSLLKMDVGTGKTIVSWFTALGATLGTNISQILILCPPTLIRQWYQFVEEFKNIPSVCAYQGTPIQRDRMYLTESIVIMGYHIFLKDFDKIYFQMRNRQVFVICDEVSFRDPSTKTYRYLRKLFYNVNSVKELNDRDEFEPDKRFILLNATPISNPGQTYGYIKQLTPCVYVHERVFDACHVAKKNRYNEPVAFKNLELLEENFKLRRLDADADVLLDLPPISFIPITYDLVPRHLSAYEKLARQDVDAIPDEFFKNPKEIDNLFARLQQMVTNPSIFGLDIVPAFLELLDERLGELGDEEKVVIFSQFKDTNRRILKHLDGKAVGLWSDFTPKQKDKSLDAFSSTVNRLIAHWKTGGVGLNLQYARHEIFVEIPPDPPSFKQAVGRIHREGQTRKQFVTIFLASGTIQERIYYNLIVKDKLIADVIGNKKSLIDFLLS